MKYLLFFGCVGGCDDCRVIRKERFNSWLGDVLGGELTVEALRGDASFRKYYRIHTKRKSFVLMDSSLEIESAEKFFCVSKMLQNSGARTPGIEYADLNKGLIILEDLGDLPLIKFLHNVNIKALYQRALTDLTLMQGVNATDLNKYDAEMLTKEMDIFRDWLCERYLGYGFSSSEEEVFSGVKNAVIKSSREQPQVFVHRDYHCRNIMVDEKGLAHIDYQDAVVGPISYDLVSLLKDCYVEWNERQIADWVNMFLNCRLSAGRAQNFTRKEFNRWFDFMGLQRHLKASGIFCRLWKRDGKPGYLKELTRVFSYMISCCDSYPEFHPFGLTLARLRALVQKSL